MSELDRRLANLGRADIDHDLSGLEADVWSKIDARSRARRLAPMPQRLAVAVCMGAAMVASGAGAAMTSAASPPRGALVFDLHPASAPSTLLDGG